MRCPVPVKNKRRVLCVFPTYTPSFGTFQHAYKLMYRVKAFMPPQGLLLIAAYMPESWQVRFIDENITPATDADLAWADVVFVTGMHIQAEQIRDMQRRAAAAGKVTVLGGPSVSAAPEMYPEIDYLHVGEMGDATDQIIRAARREPRTPAAAGRRQDQGPAAAHRVSDCRPTTRCRSAAICSARCSSRPAVRTCASSATSPASTAVSRA